MEDIEEVRKNKTGDENLIHISHNTPAGPMKEVVIGQISNDNWRVLASTAEETLSRRRLQVRVDCPGGLNKSLEQKSVQNSGHRSTRVVCAEHVYS